MWVRVRTRLLPSTAPAKSTNIGAAHEVTYDAKTDTLMVIFRDAAVAESDEDKPGVILDDDEAGNIVAIEVLDASTRVENLEL